VSKDKPRALGRGLDALLPSVPKPAAHADEPALRGIFVCPIEKIVPQKGQPRQHFDDALLEELAQSIKDHGLIEPIVVRRAPGPQEKYEIIAGERRWRATQRAGLHEIQVVVKDVSPLEAFELALVENVQRAELNPIELAEAFDRLIREHAYTHDQLAGVLKKDRSTVTNALRLLKLPGRVRGMVMNGRLSEGHARALLGAPDERTLESVAERVINGALSVREVEKLIRSAKEKKAAKEPGEKKKAAEKSLSVKDLEQRLSKALATRVEVRDKKGKGEIAISYGSLDELDRVLAQLER
jgi:ParB family transcriptional regulator, chromosome partitioning protein